MAVILGAVWRYCNTIMGTALSKKLGKIFWLEFLRCGIMDVQNGGH